MLPGLCEYRPGLFYVTSGCVGDAPVYFIAERVGLSVYLSSRLFAQLPYHASLAKTEIEEIFYWQFNRKPDCIADLEPTPTDSGHAKTMCK